MTAGTRNTDEARKERQPPRRREPNIAGILAGPQGVDDGVSE